MSIPDKYQINAELLACEQQLRALGFSDLEIQGLNSQIDAILEQGFDKYLSRALDT